MVGRRDRLRGKPDYGVDAPAVMRNLFLCGVVCLVLGLALPARLHLGPSLTIVSPSTPLFWTAGLLIGEGLLFLLYVKVGKFRHRDFMLGMHAWRGDEQVLDVGTGRGLLLVGAAKRLSGEGRATGIDIWSNVDLGGNSAAATQRNIDLEGMTARCELVSVGAQAMPFADGQFDVVVSNLCLHNIYDGPTRAEALAEIVRVLKSGGQALISDYKRTSEYAEVFRAAGLLVERRRGSLFTTFPPLMVVLARKPLA